MNNRPIIKHPDGRLRQVSQPISQEEIRTPQMQSLIDDVTQTLYVENGIGLAAPQVGVNKRLVVVDVGRGPQALINPRIVSGSIRKINFEEGCLSVPGIYGIVRRHKGVKAVALSREGKEVKISTTGLMAVVLQHEIDHLDGILFIDKVVRYTNPRRL